MTNEWDTAGDISIIDGAAVPSISSGMRSFEKYSDGTAVGSRDIDGLVEKAMEMIDTNGFLIYTSSNININVQNGADRLEETFESTAIIDDDKTSKTNFRKEALDQ